jgi:hypothetical protein
MKSYRFRILLLVLLCLAAFDGNAQAPGWDWVSHNNLAKRYYVNVVTDQNGYIYAGGNDSLGFVLTKYKPSGVKIWSTTDASTVGRKLFIDAAGNLYITATESTGPFMMSIITAKLDSAGNRLWTKGTLLPPLPNDLPSGALFTGAADPDGNTYLSGVFKHLTHFDTIALSNLAPDNYFLAKYNSAGKIQWLRFFNDPVYAITCGPQGSYFLECGTNFQKYAATGTLIWSQSFSGTINASTPFIFWNNLKSDTQGNLYVLGNKLAKYNSNGTFVWANTLTYAGNDFSLTTAGNILMTGYFQDTAAFGNGVPDLTSVTAEKALFVAQFSGVDGSADWARQASTSGSNSGEAISCLPNGSCVVAGNFTGGSTFGQLSVTGKGFFVAKLSGNILGKNENRKASSFTLYPNPATSEITIAGNQKPGTLEIFSLTGRKVYETKLVFETKLKVTDWPAGMYLVKITSEGKTQTQKLLVTD